MNITLNVAVISHIGCVRSNNEDNFFVDGDRMESKEVNDGACIATTVKSPYHVMAVCDGMGGLENGERASFICINRLKELMTPLGELEIRNRIENYARGANKAVCDDNQKRNGVNKREGTTLAVVYINDKIVHVANVGDSRVYVRRLGQLKQVSRDQSAVYRMMLAGELTREQMRKHADSNKIDCYIGIPKERMSRDFVNHNSFMLCKGDRILICSDGLSDVIPEDEINRLMSAETVREASRNLVDTALELGGKDNVTVIVAEAMDDDLPEPNASQLAKMSMNGGDTETATITRS